MSERKVYLVTRNEAQHIGYDEYNAHVIIANSPSEARKMCPKGDEGAVWTIEAVTDCKYIGISKLKPQVLLSSFNAG